MREGVVNQNYSVFDTILDIDLGLSYDFFEKHQDNNYNNKKKMLPVSQTQNGFVKCKTRYKTFLIPKTSFIQCNVNNDVGRLPCGLATEGDNAQGLATEIDEIEWSE